MRHELDAFFFFLKKPVIQFIQLYIKQVAYGNASLVAYLDQVIIPQGNIGGPRGVYY